MLIVISPAKKLNFQDPAPTKLFSQPQFLDDSQKLINTLNKHTPTEISSLMKLSPKLTELNVKRYQDFQPPFTLDNAKQALFAFQGDTYQGLDANSFSSLDLEYAQKHLKILSGLYGLLKPLDLIQAYRLEMGTKLTCQGHKNLYEFWNKMITQKIKLSLKTEQTLVNLASKEYFSAIDTKDFSNQIITPIFKDYKNGLYKIISFHAKKARGMMAHFMIKNQVNHLAQLKQFKSAGYRFNSQLTKLDHEPVFTRD